METLGDHNLVELYGCDPNILSNRDSVESIVLEGGKVINVTPIFHRFEKTEEGVSGAEVIAESHISAHTSSPIKYVNLDIYTCGKGLNVEGGINFYFDAFKAKHAEKTYLGRGFLPTPGQERLDNLIQRELISRYDVKKVGTLSKHIIADFYLCNPEKISHEKTVAPAMFRAARTAEPEGFPYDKILVNQFHNFKPHGTSGLILGANKHLTIHTWPEHDYASVDMLLSKDNDSWTDAVLYLKERFDSKNVIIKPFGRGNPEYLKY